MLLYLYCHQEIKNRDLLPISAQVSISGNESSLISSDNLEYDFDLSVVIKNSVTLFTINQ